LKSKVQNLEEYKILKYDNYTYRDLIPRITENGITGYDSAFDVEAVKWSLKNLFIINQGEVPGKPRFGNTLKIDLFENFDHFTESSLKASIENLVARYEPRVRIIDINITMHLEFHRIIIEIIFSVNIRENNIEDSLYLPFSSNDFTYIAGRLSK